jgi:hypothetical protein
MEHIKVCLQNVPISLRDVVSCFLTVGSGELKGAMDKHVKISLVEPFPKGT